jgi:ammonia channel protein AmtB
MYGTVGLGTQVGFDSAADMHSLFFQTVFAATAATIVSGLKEQNSRLFDILFIDDFTYLSNFW